MENKIGCLIINVESTTLSPEEKDLIGHPLVGGVILFSRNYESPSQLRELCQAIRFSRQQALLIMVDQEGGRVQRFIEGFTRLPAFSLYGRIYDQEPQKALKLAEQVAWLMAAELLDTGVDLSLSPVLDLNKEISSIIGERAFHRQPGIVIELAQAFIRGMKGAGMAALGKHFPGHGSVQLDSHLSLPMDNRSFEEIYRDDMQTFTALIQSNIPAIMAAHIVFPKIDSKAVGYSSIWLKDILRKQLQYKGLVLSDDINMEGANISANYADRFAIAREAGCDLVLLCNNKSAVIKVIDQFSNLVNEHSLAYEKWQPLQGKLSKNDPLKDKLEWQKARQLLAQYQDN